MHCLTQNQDAWTDRCLSFKASMAPLLHADADSVQCRWDIHTRLAGWYRTDQGKPAMLHCMQRMPQVAGLTPEACIIRLASATLV